MRGMRDPTRAIATAIVQLLGNAGCYGYVTVSGLKYSVHRSWREPQSGREIASGRASAPLRSPVLRHRRFGKGHFRGIGSREGGGFAASAFEKVPVLRHRFGLKRGVCDGRREASIRLSPSVADRCLCDGAVPTPSNRVLGPQNCR